MKGTGFPSMRQSSVCSTSLHADDDLLLVVWADGDDAGTVEHSRSSVACWTNHCKLSPSLPFVVLKQHTTTLETVVLIGWHVCTYPLISPGY